MTTTTLSSREFNQNASGAKKAAENGPVIITDRGKPAHVLLTFDQYQELSGKKKSIVELLSMPGMEDIDFDPPRLGTELVRPANFLDEM
jgi:prevent-host-death family protein